MLYLKTFGETYQLCAYWCLAVSVAVMSVDLGSEWMKMAIVKPGVPMEIVLNKWVFIISYVYRRTCLSNRSGWVEGSRICTLENLKDVCLLLTQALIVTRMIITNIKALKLIQTHFLLNCLLRCESEENVKKNKKHWTPTFNSKQHKTIKCSFWIFSLQFTIGGYDC